MRTQQMLVALLEDRFKLRTHEEQREVEVYRVVLNRPDGQFGPKLLRASTTVQEDVQLPPEKRRCGLLTIAPGRFAYKCASLQMVLDAAVQTATQRRVIDATGLSGQFEVDLTWDPAFEQPPDQRAPSDAPSIFTAVREQLGLRLEPAKARVPVLVIDSVSPPAEE